MPLVLSKSITHSGWRPRPPQMQAQRNSAGPRPRILRIGSSRRKNRRGAADPRALERLDRPVDENTFLDPREGRCRSSHAFRARRGKYYLRFPPAKMDGRLSEAARPHTSSPEGPRRAERREYWHVPLTPTARGSWRSRSTVCSFLHRAAASAKPMRPAAVRRPVRGSLRPAAVGESSALVIIPSRSSSCARDDRRHQRGLADARTTSRSHRIITRSTSSAKEKSTTPASAAAKVAEKPPRSRSPIPRRSPVQSRREGTMSRSQKASSAMADSSHRRRPERQTANVT